MFFLGKERKNIVSIPPLAMAFSRKAFPRKTTLSFCLKLSDLKGRIGSASR